jgi:hypothetical protein
MNPSRIEAIWLARIVRLFAAKELFDAVMHFGSTLLHWANLVPFGAEPGSNTARTGFWGVISLVLALLLLRGARQIATFCVGATGTRRVARSISMADSIWLSIGLRAFGVWSILAAVGYALEGVYFALSDANTLASSPDSTATYFLSWSMLYAIGGAILCRRPDVLGILMMSAKEEPKA